MEVKEAGDNVHVLICIHPVGNPEGPPDYIAVELPVQKLMEEVCGDMSQKKGMSFEKDSPADAEDLVLGWECLKAERDQQNELILRDLAKGKKKAPRKQAAKPPVEVTTAQGSPADIAAVKARSPSKPKMKGKGKDNPNRVITFTLNEAMSRGNHLMKKTKDNEVNAIYQALEFGLLHAFPYKKWRLLGVIQSDRLHIAPDKLKYRKIAKDHLVQVPQFSSCITPYSMHPHYLQCIGWQPTLLPRWTSNLINLCHGGRHRMYTSTLLASSIW